MLFLGGQLWPDAYTASPKVRRRGNNGEGLRGSLMAVAWQRGEGGQLRAVL